MFAMAMLWRPLNQNGCVLGRSKDITLRLWPYGFCYPALKPGGVRGRRQGNHRNRPGFNITANSHPLLRSSQTVHTRDPAIRCERCLLPGRFLEGSLSIQVLLTGPRIPPALKRTRRMMDVFISFFGDTSECCRWESQRVSSPKT